MVEHCVNSAKDGGFDSQGTHILMKMYNLNAILSCKRLLNVNVNKPGLQPQFSKS